MSPTFLLLSLLLTTALSLTHRHVRPAEKLHHFLHGRINGVAFSAKLLKDVLLWDELSKHQFRLSSCKILSPSVVHVEVTSPHLDHSDFSKGTAFVIASDHWTEACGALAPSSEISEHDPTSFFLIRNVVRRDGTHPTISLRLKRVPGSNVVPSCKVKKLPAHLRVAERDSILFEKYEESVFHPTFRQLDFLPTIPVQQPDVNLNSIYPGATIRTVSSLDASVDNFEFVRFFGLEVSWEQSLRVNATSRLTASTSYRASDSREIYRKIIPDLSISQRIPFVGTFRVEAFKKMDVLQSISMDENLIAYVAATSENQMKVTAKFSSKTLSIENLLPPGFGSAGEGNVDFGSVIRHDVGITGFFGVVPGISVVGSLGSTSYEAVADVALGMEASIQKQVPPFRPLPDATRAFGVCDECHEIRVSARIVGKDLQTKLYEDGFLEDQETHISSLFTYPVASICALQKTC